MARSISVGLRQQRLRGRELGKLEAPKPVTEDFASKVRDQSVSRLARVQQQTPKRAEAEVGTSIPAMAPPPSAARPQPVQQPVQQAVQSPLTIGPTPSAMPMEPISQVVPGVGAVAPTPDNPTPAIQGGQVTGAQVAAARGGGLKGWGSVLADTAQVMAPLALSPVMAPSLLGTVPSLARGVHNKGSQMQSDVASTQGMVPAVTDPGAMAMRGIHAATGGYGAAPAPAPGTPAAAVADATAIGGPSMGGTGICIIVSSCTDPFSYEVDITREYRDTRLTEAMLRGYYKLAAYVVPWIKRHEWFKWLIKRGLVDRLIDHGEVELGYKPVRERVLSATVSKGFLRLIQWIGKK